MFRLRFLDVHFLQMNRYLLNISYIGTNFRGIQKTVNKLQEPRLDTHTIQGCIELALRGLHPQNEIQTVLSSRTDAGVHALHSTMHVDLRKYDDQPYCTKTITGVLNRILAKESLPIRVLSTQLVPDTFHCRYNAFGRTYLYRLAVAKESTTSDENLGNKSYYSFIPIEELDRCFFLQVHNFDIERFQRASRMFLGQHDFRTFMSVSRQQDPRRNNPMYTVRSIREIIIESGKSLATGANATEAERLFNYWNIRITAKSFVYKQIRRIIGTLIAVATDRIDEKSIYEMLTIPSKHSWNPRISLSPASGLYLCKVHYDPKDLEFRA